MKFEFRRFFTRISFVMMKANGLARDSGKKSSSSYFQKNTFCFVFRDRRDNGVRSTSKIEKRRDRAQAEKERGSSFI
jgi:hypothetical protein